VARERALGRGLAALMAEFPGGGASLVDLDIDRIRPNPRQPRKTFDDVAIASLAESIAAGGVLQPIVVRGAEGGYEIIAGERRWRAAHRAGLKTIPAIVRDADDRESLVLALVENVAREDLNAVEQARAYAALADELELSQAEIARRVGKSRPAVANTMRLLELPDGVLDRVERGELSEGHARALLAVEGQDEREALAGEAVRRGWTVREIEAAARRRDATTRPRRRTTPPWLDEELAHLAVDAAWQSLGLRAAVKGSGKGGALEIRFASADELGRIVDQLRGAGVDWAD
jgi:ParB family transcriptional regulator, chromosome partitioning protein